MIKNQSKIFPDVGIGVGGIGASSIDVGGIGAGGIDVGGIGAGDNSRSDVGANIPTSWGGAHLPVGSLITGFVFPPSGVKHCVPETSIAPRECRIEAIHLQFW